MAIPDIEQPEILMIENDLRLRKFDEVFDFAFSWYQDVETVYLVDGVKRPYSWETLENMYHYLEKQGELYFVEVLEDDWKPIGDVCFWREDLPIVIGEPAYRRRGIGRKVIEALVRRGRELGYNQLKVNEIYHWNIGSRNCFECIGFRCYEETEQGGRFYMKL